MLVIKKLNKLYEKVCTNYIIYNVKKLNLNRMFFFIENS